MLNPIIYNIKSLLKKPFKIGVISTQYPEKKVSNQGIAIHVETLTRYLTQLGCEVHVFTAGKRKSTKKEYIGEGKRVIHRINTDLNVSSKDPVITKRIVRAMFDSQVINEIIKENSKTEFDILHSHMGISGVLLSKYSQNIKTVHTVHSLGKNMIKFMPEEEKKYYNLTNWMERAMIYTDAIISVSKTVKKEILDTYPAKEERVFYIPNGVDLDVFRPHPNNSRQNKIVYVGRFDYVKGIDYLPKIIEKTFMRNKDLKFEIVAPDTKKLSETNEKIKQQMENLVEKYPDRIIWHRKPLSREELAQVYNECIIAIQPSRYEAFGMTVVEAMACGTTVIVSDRGALPEVVNNAGIVVPLNTYAFAREITRLVEDYKLRERYSRRGIERVKEFTWQEIAKQTLDLYKVISKKVNQENGKEKPHEKVHEGLQNLDELHKKEKETEEKIKEKAK